MVTDKIGYRYSWGDTVRIAKDSPNEYRPNESGSVCGLRKIEDQGTANKFKAKLGEYLYIIEFTNGESMEIPESYLEEAAS